MLRFDTIFKKSKTGRKNDVEIEITGFLGAGKTTVINHLVNQPGMKDTALIINEFGEIGLDNLLIESAIENTLVLENGCICCSIRGDLVDTIIDLFIKQQNDLIPKFSRILIETTGLAQPDPIAETLSAEKLLADRCALKNVVAIVDGQQGLSQLESHHEVATQLAQADLALISKSDLSEEAALEALEKRVTAINPALTVQMIKNGEIDPDALFRSELHLNRNKPAHHHHEEHDLASVETWSFNSSEPLNAERLQDWLSMLYSLRPFAMLRLKGILQLIDQEQPVLLQAVGSSFSPPELLDAWPGGLEETNLVLIFRDISSTDIEISFKQHVLK
jgi:G3E family GTPase